MAKKMKEADMNLYYMNQGQAPKENIEEMIKTKKAKEREKRIKQNKNKKGAGNKIHGTDTLLFLYCDNACCMIEILCPSQLICRS